MPLTPRRPKLTVVPKPDPLAVPRQRLRMIRVGGLPIEPVAPRARKEALPGKRISRETFGKVIALAMHDASSKGALS